jgi:hypothetical protein
MELASRVESLHERRRNDEGPSQGVGSECVNGGVQIPLPAFDSFSFLLSGCE